MTYLFNSLVGIHVFNAKSGDEEALRAGAAGDSESPHLCAKSPAGESSIPFEIIEKDYWVESKVQGPGVGVSAFLRTAAWAR